MSESADKNTASTTFTPPLETPSNPPNEEVPTNNVHPSSQPVQSQENAQSSQSRDWNLLNPSSSNRQEPVAEYGRADMEPFATNPFAPPSLFGPRRGGMIFNGGRNAQPQRGPRWGGDGFLPPMGAPPRARFDPVGPGPQGPSRRIGKPDNDEFLPPGMGDDMSR